ncbi:hypothetical protein [Mycolicibacterium palauense]|uniref:hypothetical protein n=1 Tax=Mycolicibacterium palauense TaxID=2034511 RepID=UPI000BFEDF07|nr:hypothetical protein [Mycolicibacterium palauense]
MASLMTRPEPVDRVRVAALDVAHSRRRSTVLVGPLALPPWEVLVERFSALADGGPLTRLCLQPSTHTNHWHRLPVDATRTINVTDPLPAGAPPTRLLPAVRALRAENGPDGLHILCAGDQLAIDFSHGLGEVPLVQTVLDVLFGAVDARDPTFLAPYRHRIPPLLSAGVRTFASDPRRIASVLGAYRRRPIPSVPVGAQKTSGVFKPSPCTRFVGVPGEFVTEVRRRRDAALPGVSMVTLCTYALWECLADAGLTVENIVKIPFDVRRYLRTGSDTLASFSAGLDFAIDADDGPVGLQAEMDRSARSGRPVANLLVGALKARRRRADVAERHPGHPRVRLLHSNVGRAARVHLWPFTDRGAAHILVASDPMNAEGVTVTSAWTSDNLWLTAEFHDTVFDPDRVDEALRTVADRMHDLTQPRLG